MPTLIQPSFARGEIGPQLYGRVDTAAYQIALRKARNCIVHPYGGVSNRNGLLWCAPVKTHTYAPRLIPFKFKTSDTYILEFGNLYMRVMRNDEHVTEAAKTITGATAANPVVITSAGHGYSNGDEVFIDGVVGMTQLNGRRFIVANVAANTFELKDQVTATNLNGLAYTAYSSGGTASKIYEITTPYATADLDELSYNQSADVMTLTHPGYAVRELQRTGHASWTLTSPTFTPDQTWPTAITVTPDAGAGTTVRYRVTATSEDGEESLPGLHTAAAKTITGVTAADPAVVTSAGHGLSNGDEVYITGITGMTELNGRRFTIAGVAANTFQLEGEDSTTYTAYSAGGTATPTFTRITNSAATFANTVAWTAAADADKYTIYREKNGVFGFIGESETTTFYDANVLPDLDITPPRQRDPFRGTDNYPGTSSYYEQRRVFGGSRNKPDTAWYSQIGAQNNMSVSSPTQDDDAITATLNALEVNEIRHFVPLTDLIVLTSGSEWRVNSGQDAAFSASTLKQKPQSYWGSSRRKPIVAGNTVLYVQENEAAVRSLGYSLQIDSYTGNDMSLLASHLFQTYTISDWAYARSPDQIIHIVRSDGKALAFTFNQEQEIIAWTTWDTLGKFERVASIRPSSDTLDDAAYFVVKRTVNGQTVRYIERTHTRRFTDVRDCFFVDSGLSYDSPLTITDVAIGSTTVITSASHGLSNGDYVDLFDIVWEPDFDDVDTETQPDQLNRQRYKVANVATNTFEIQTSAGAAIVSTAYNDYVEGGTARKAVLTVSGFWHLEGRTVVALCDGNVVTGLTVSSGTITLPRRFSRVHVGLRYITDVETLDIEAPQGTMQGKLKKISGVTIRMKDSVGLFVGNAEDDLEEAPWRENEAMGEPNALLTGDKYLQMPESWNTKGRMFFRQSAPLPMTILAVIPRFQVGDDDAP